MRPIAWTRCRPGASVASSCRVAASQTLTEPSSHLMQQLVGSHMQSFHRRNAGGKKAGDCSV